MCGDCFPIPLQQASNCNGTVHMRYAWNNESDTCTATQVIDCDSSFADTFASLEECMSYASSRGKYNIMYCSYTDLQSATPLKIGDL